MVQTEHQCLLFPLRPVHTLSNIPHKHQASREYRCSHRRSCQAHGIASPQLAKVTLGAQPYSKERVNIWAIFRVLFQGEDMSIYVYREGVSEYVYIYMSI